MRIFKTVLWIVLMYVLQTAFGNVISLYRAIPDLILIFGIVYSVCETDKKNAVCVMLICSILDASTVGRIFPLMLLIYGFSGTLVCTAEPKNGFFGFMKSALFVSSTSLIYSILEYLIIYRNINIVSMAYNILPFVLYTLIWLFVIYPIAACTLFGKKNKRLLIV